MKKVLNEEQAQKPKKEKKTATVETYGDVPELIKLVNTVRNAGLSVPSLMSLVKLKNELRGFLEEYNDTLKAILEEKFELKQENGGYSWVEHPKAADINAEVDALRKQPVKLKSKLNFLSFKELSAATQNLDLAIVSDIAEKLAANE